MKISACREEETLTRGDHPGIVSSLSELREVRQSVEWRGESKGRLGRRVRPSLVQCYDWLVTRLKEQRAEACTYGNELSKPACDGGGVIGKAISRRGLAIGARFFFCWTGLAQVSKRVDSRPASS